MLKRHENCRFFCRWLFHKIGKVAFMMVLCVLYYKQPSDILGENGRLVA